MNFKTPLNQSLDITSINLQLISIKTFSAAIRNAIRPVQAHSIVIQPKYQNTILKVGTHSSKLSPAKDCTMNIRQIR